MATRPAEPGEVNYHLVDRWTLGHGLIGIVLGIAGLSFRQAFLVGALWEIVERPLKDKFPEQFPSATQDSFQNALGDAVAMALGAHLVKLKGRGRRDDGIPPALASGARKTQTA